MAYKRLEEHTFTWPAVKDGLMLMNHAQFEALFAGLDWRRVRAIEAKISETLFPSLHHARATLAAWRTDYNTECPHARLGWQTPAEFALACTPQCGLTLARRRSGQFTVARWASRSGATVLFGLVSCRARSGAVFARS